ncbi:hypothetical protein IG631_23664 [Alternaria alternata]|nr:hypothetical protein IG631_23664 [Alternaria alternata]
MSRSVSAVTQMRDDASLMLTCPSRGGQKQIGEQYAAVSICTLRYSHVLVRGGIHFRTHIQRLSLKGNDRV